MKVGRFTQLAAFDSATAMVAALSKSLKGEGFALVGTLPSWTESLVAPFSSLVNGIPSKLREKIFVQAGRSESILIDPQWILQSGTVPYWTVFGIQSSLNRVLKYLGQMADKPAFDEIFAVLFPHGVQSVGLASVSEWRKLVEFARSSFRFVGVDEKAYPRDFGAFLRYHRDLWRSTLLSSRPVEFVNLETVLSFIRTLGGPRGVLLRDAE